MAKSFTIRCKLAYSGTFEPGTRKSMNQEAVFRRKNTKTDKAILVKHCTIFRILGRSLKCYD